jgi:hypothetical protein
VTWTVKIFETRTGEPQQEVEVSAGSWDRRLTGRGRGSHTIPLFEQGISQATIRELAMGNKYTICQMWDDHVVYAGVIQRTRYDQPTRRLTVDSAELRVAYANSRMLYGVTDYHPTNAVLTVTSKGYSGAARAVINAALPGDFALPIDLPSDNSGGFSKTWYFHERLKWEDHLTQIEASGCEIDFAPYLDGSGWLRWATRVATKITSGSATAIVVGGTDSPLIDLQVETDYALQMTGVLAFGPGGTSAASDYAPSTGTGAGEISVRDVWINYPDLDDSQLQAAADAAYALLRYPTEQWSFGLHVYPDGPEFTAPGRLLTLTASGDEFIPDGDHAKRVVGLRGDMGYRVTPEVQDAA